MTLDAQLRALAAHSAEYPVMLANHLPMLVVALDRMGADMACREQLAAYYITVHDLLAVPDDAGRIAAGNWRERLGDRSLEGDFRTFFIAETHRLGIDAVIDAALPTLARGVAASALHALMRLAYARLRRDPVETGIALGYWAACFLDLGEHEASPPTDDPAEVLRALATDPALEAVAIDAPLLWYFMRDTAALPSFGAAAGRLRCSADAIDRMASVGLALFAATGAFAALHAVTGAHWLRLVGRTGLARYFWQAIAATTVNMGRPVPPDPDEVAHWRSLPAPDWPEIHRQACRSLDEHDISLVFSAWQEDLHRRDPLYRVVAARRVGLIP